MIYSSHLRQSMVLLAVLGLAGILAAADAAEAPEKGERPWQPVPPQGMPTDFDWIQLTSDEWLKGEIIVMYDDSLEFDSDELDNLSLDWEDVRQVRTAQIVQVGLIGRAPATGKLAVDGTAVRVIAQEEEQSFNRSEVLSITAGEPREINYWNFKVTLGATLSSGNTEQTEMSSKVRIMRRTVRNRMVFDYIGNYSITSEIETANNHRVSAVWERFVNNRLFVAPVFVEYYRDPFSNIDYRATLGAGLGYKLVETKQVEWAVSGGPGYQKTRYVDVEPDTPITADTPALVITSVADIELANWVDFLFNYRIQVTDEESGFYNHHLVTGFETEITSLLDFDVTLVWDRIKNPREASDGIVPEPDDFRLVVGLTFDF
jgi:putative salt-induced outer membrane protein YdiY